MWSPNTWYKAISDCLRLTRWHSVVRRSIRWRGVSLLVILSLLMQVLGGTALTAVAAQPTSRLAEISTAEAARPLRLEVNTRDSTSSSFGPALIPPRFQIDNSWVLNGAANDETLPGKIILTPDTTWQRGSSWRADPIDLTQSFDKTFTVYLGSKDGTGADGIVFVLQSQGTGALGDDGLGMGYTGISPSIGIEIDTWVNSGDPSYDHMAVNENGSRSHNGAAPVQASASSANVEDGAEHSLRVVWDAPSQTLAAYFDDVQRLTYTRDLVGDIFSGNSSVFYGLTAGTGTRSNLHYFSEETASPYHFWTSLSPPSATLNAGGLARYEIHIANTGLLADTYSLSVSDLDAAWATFSQSQVGLAPGGSADVTLTVAPPGCQPETTVAFSVSVESLESGQQQSLPAELSPVPSPEIILESPPDGMTSGSRSVLFGWRTSPATTGTLRLHPAGQPGQAVEYTTPTSTTHTVQVDDLIRNTTYQWTVQADSECGSENSPARSFSVGTGIVFVDRNPSFTIDRDYNQVREITVRNDDVVSHTLVAIIQSPYQDLIVNFVGSGSVDETITLGPSESRIIQLALNAQDAELRDYDLLATITADEGTGTPMVDTTSVHCRVFGEFHLMVEETGVDPATGARTFRVTNLGQTISDLAIDALDPASGQPARAYMVPGISHARLDTDESLSFKIVPLFDSRDVPPGLIPVDLVFSGAGRSEVISTSLECAVGQVYPVTLHGMCFAATVGDWYCTNRPNISMDLETPHFIDPAYVSSVDLHATITPRSAYVKPHTTTVSLNDVEVARLVNTIPSGTYRWRVPPTALNTGLAGPVVQRLDLTSQHSNGGHYVVATGFTLGIGLDQVTTYVCAESEAQAEQNAIDVYGFEPIGPSPACDGIDIPPAAITDLAAVTGSTPGTVDLTWTAPGDDGTSGTASAYVVRYADSAIVSEADWAAATDVDSEPTPQAAGSSESMTVSGLAPGQTYYFMVRAEDEVPNLSGLGNSPSAVAGAPTATADLALEPPIQVANSSKPYPPNRLSLIAAVRNDSSSVTVPNVMVTFYDGDPDSGGEVISDTVSVGDLGPGDIKPATVSWELNGNIVDHRVYARATTSAPIADSDPGNNTISQTISVYYVDFLYNEHAYKFENKEVGKGSDTFDLIRIITVEFDFPEIMVSPLRPVVGLLTEMAGYCYGMSNSSVVYFFHPELIPVPDTTTHNLTVEEARAKIRTYQWYGLEPFFDILLEPETSYSPSEQYRLTLESVQNGRPVIHGLMDRTGPLPKKGTHAVVAYKIVDLKSRQYVYYYDPNFPLDSNYAGRTYGVFSDSGFVEPIYPFQTPSMFFNKAYAVQHQLSFSDNFRSLLFDLVRWILNYQFSNGVLSVSSVGAVDLMAVDSSGRRVGYLADQEYNDVPGAETTKVSGMQSLLLPVGDTYQLQVTGSDATISTLDIMEVITPSLDIVDPVSDSAARIIQFQGLNLTQGQTATAQFFHGLQDPTMMLPDGTNRPPDVNVIVKASSQTVYLPVILKAY